MHSRLQTNTRTCRVAGREAGLDMGTHTGSLSLPRRRTEPPSGIR